MQVSRYPILAAWFAGALTCNPLPGATTPAGGSVSVTQAPCGDHALPDAVPLGETVTFGDFVGALTEPIARLDRGAMRPDYLELAARRGWDPDTDGLFDDYVRVRTLFEATRDGGYWRLRWAITDREPSSSRIWQAWRNLPLREAFGHASATAECDELSALFALLARRVGVRSVGLFYPTWNHTIAAWAPHQLPRGRSRLVLVPTTQIFLGCADGLDTTSFRTALTSIGQYPRWDVRDTTPLPPSVARFLLEEVRVYGGTSSALQALLRARRALAFGSSMGACPEYRAELARTLGTRLGCADRAALRHFAERELDRASASAEQVLEMLGAP